MPFVGAAQVQVTNSLFYLTIANSAMLVLTYWSTAGVSIAATYVPWMGLPEFVAIGFVGFLFLMLFDLTVMYPHRQAFLNKRAYVYRNPAVEDLQTLKADTVKLKADMVLIKQALGIDTEGAGE